ncbi:MAG: hypothetical protein GDA56_12230 [Hormoscilla sp. GM7CHS1pb]|nr:hypothetical protein [Hormoscilla sp. GM7CHS1pb]
MWSRAEIRRNELRSQYGILLLKSASGARSWRQSLRRGVPSQRLGTRKTIKKAVYLVPRVSLGTLLEAQPRVPEAGGRASEGAFPARDWEREKQ